MKVTKHHSCMERQRTKAKLILQTFHIPTFPWMGHNAYRPSIRSKHLPCVDQNRLWLLAIHLLLTWYPQSTTHYFPEQIPLQKNPIGMKRQRRLWGLQNNQFLSRVNKAPTQFLQDLSNTCRQTLSFFKPCCPLVWNQRLQAHLLCLPQNWSQQLLDMLTPLPQR